MTVRIRSFDPTDAEQVLDLSLRAWTPVFNDLKPAVPDFVYTAFYPDGWQARQAADIARLMKDDSTDIHVADGDGALVGYVGIRLHPEDKMGEIHILAVDPNHQRHGVATALLDFAMNHIRKAGMDIVMVETGDDPGHAASRATYERAGFTRWPVARYFQKL